jgi:hypothetical protein
VRGSEGSERASEGPELTLVKRHLFTIGFYTVASTFTPEDIENELHIQFLNDIFSGSI